MLYLLRISVILGFFAGVFKYLDYKKPERFVQIFNMLLNFCTKNTLGLAISNFCYTTTTKYFNLKYEKIFSILSGLTIPLGVYLRLFVLFGGTMPYSTPLLFILGLNSVFRSIIGYGKVLTGNVIWHDFLEQASKSASRVRYPTPQNPQNNFDPEKNQNKNNSDNQSENNSGDKKKHKDDTWNRAGAVGSMLGGAGAVAGIYAWWENIGEKNLHKREREFFEERRAFDQERRAFEEKQRILAEDQLQKEKKKTEKWKNRARGLQDEIDVKKMAEDSAKKEVNDLLKKNKR